MTDIWCLQTTNGMAAEITRFDSPAMHHEPSVVTTALALRLYISVHVIWNETMPSEPRPTVLTAVHAVSFAWVAEYQGTALRETC